MVQLQAVKQRELCVPALPAVPCDAVKVVKELGHSFVCVPWKRKSNSWELQTGGCALSCSHRPGQACAQVSAEGKEAEPQGG